MLDRRPSFQAQSTSSIQERQTIVKKGYTKKSYVDDESEVAELDQAWFDQAIRVHKLEAKKAISPRFAKKHWSGSSGMGRAFNLVCRRC
jgi:hypothetical protein